MDKAEYAVQLKHSGYNCAQAVLCAFAQETALSEEMLKKIGAAYGVGMGCMEATCGALCAAQILMGLKKYEKRPVLRDAADLLRQFESLCGASVCKVLKGRETGVVLCECDDCVRNAVRILQQDNLYGKG